MNADTRHGTVIRGKRLPWIRVAAATLLLLLGATPTVAQQQARAADRLLVRFRPGTTSDEAAAVHRGIGASLLRQFRTIRGLAVVRLPAGLSLRDAMRAYRRQSQVLYVEPDYVIHVTATPNDTDFAQLWGLNNTGQTGGTPGADIHALQAWDITTGSANVVVGILDTGIDYNHPDLAANVYRNQADCNNDGIDNDGDGYVDDCYGIDTFNHDSDPMDDYSHGTHVSGTIGAVGNNGQGVTGVNWNVKLFACKFLDANGSGYISGAVECLDYFAWQKDHGVNLVATNNSWAGGGYSQALADALEQQRQRGILFFAAAGNGAADNDAFSVYPADYGLPNVVAVAATDASDQLAGLSDYGNTSVGLGAPGVSIVSTLPGGAYGGESGTSMATPFVTGVAALLAAQDPARGMMAIRNLILAGADPVPALTGKTITGGRLNAYNAMTCSNRLVRHRMLPRADAVTVPIGQSVTLSMISLNCVQSSASETITVIETGESIHLLDDGVLPDAYAGDGLFTAQWTPAAIGVYTLAYPGGEQVTVTVEAGYSFSATPYVWRSITGTPLNLPSLSPPGAHLALPFPVQFGGTAVSSLYVSQNGTVSPNLSVSTGANEPLPATSIGNGALVAPLWETNLYADAYYGSVGTAPNREFVLEWRGIPDPSCDTTPFFQVVFSEASSNVVFNYANVDPTQFCGDDDGQFGTVGIQLTGDNATQYSYLAPSLTNQQAILWTMTGDNPAPRLDQLVPAQRAAGTGAFTLTAQGAGFVFGSQLLWNGSARPTTVVNGHTLTATIGSADVASLGTATVTISNPSPGGGTSAGASFPIVPLGSLTVTAPNGGELWTPGETRTISWSASGEAGATVRLELLEGSSVTPIAASVPAAANSYAWTVPLGLNGSDFLVRVASNDYPQVADTSDALFLIRPSQWIGVTSPAAGAVWPVATQQTITWRYNGLIDNQNMAVSLFQAGVFLTSVATPPIGSNGSGSYVWQIPGGLAPASNYEISISPTNCCGWTIGPDFTLTPPPMTLVLTSPNGGEQWTAGTTHAVTWHYTGAPGNVKLELLRSGSLAQTISSNAAVGSNGSGSFSWLVPSTTALGNGYRIRITSLSTPAVTDSSDADFRINHTGIAVTSPNGGESWQAGTTRTIKWIYYGSVGTAVRIDLYKSGVLNRTLVSSTSIGLGGSGQYSWAIPASQTEGSGYSVKVTSTLSSTYTDTSDAGFSIVNTGLTLTAPNGGEVWAPGTSHNITWTYTGNPGTDLKLELLKSGAVVSTLATAAPIGSNGTDSFVWAIPANQAIASDYSVRATSNQSSQYTDSSNANFTIDLRYTLTVNKTGTGTATIASSPAGINCPTTCSATFSSGTPVTLTETPSAGTTFNGWSGSCSGTATTCPVTMSSDQTVGAAFTGPTVGITVVSPNGGEIWSRGTAHTIKWTYSGAVGSFVKIELLKSGVLNRTITSFASVGSSGSGSFSWTIPLLQTTGSNFTIRITSTTNATYTDSSNATFTIQ